MRVAFDYGGVLSHGGQIVDLLHALQAAGCDIHVITTVGSEVEGAGRKQALRDVGVEIPEQNLHIIVDSHPDYHSRYRSHGEAKVYVMRHISCDILFDDADGVINAVRDSGLIGFQVKK